MKLITSDEFAMEFKNRGFYYSKDLIFNYFNCLISKPFVILTGISGSGKSKIAEIFAEIVSDSADKQYELIPVKPNWRDNKGLFGFHNLIDDSYYITQLIGLFIRALKNSDKPYFLILDEMNIAKTEHYFADYLSLIESRRIINTNIKNVSECSLEELEKFFHFDKKDYSLSMAIILAAIDINKTDEFLDVEIYRKNKFVEKWKLQNSNSSSWTAQVREEFHVGTSGNRLAYKVFEPIDAGGKLYRLKKFDSISLDEQKIIDKLKHIYKNSKIKVDAYDDIIQENIVLHNSPWCLGTGSNTKCSCEHCPYTNSKKYRCDKLYDSTTETYLIPPEIPIPLNVFTVGTVNVDETTYMFSPKVLDRSNVIEFNEVDFSELYDLDLDMKDILSNRNLSYKNDDFYFDSGSNLPAVKITMPTIENVNKFLKTSGDEYTDLLNIFAVLKKYNMQFGYRVMNEISKYICNIYDNTSYPDHAIVGMDLQLLQKVLPKFYGAYDKLWRPLVEVLNMCQLIKKEWAANIDADDLKQELMTALDGKKIINFELTTEQAKKVFKYPRTATKILTMLSDLNTVGFATFIK